MDKSELKSALKGRNPEQKKVIKYFYGEGGCLSFISPGLKDADYEALVQSHIQGQDFRKKALGKIGLDESQVNEIEPVHFEGYLFDDKNSYAKWIKDKKIWVSSQYQITWIFFSSSQIYIYQNTFNMDNDVKKEKTEEYFYKDITNFSASTDTVEKWVLDKVSCKGESSYARKNVDENRFAIVVPGDKFYCAMDANEYTERAIQGMKAKLREKKG